MPEATDVREWLRSQGEDVPARGRVPVALQRRYDEAHAPDDSMGVTEDDFPSVAEDAITADPPPAPKAPSSEAPAKRATTRATERAPRKITPAKRGWRDLFGSKGTAKPKARKPREDLSEFAADLWSDLAGITRPIPPVSNVLKVQAPYAAVMFDDAVKGVPLVDAVLQPIARYSVSMRAVNGLLGPPLLTMAICTTGTFVVDEQSGRPRIHPETGRPIPDVRTGLMLGSLRYSLKQMAKVADLEKVAERAAHDAATDAQIDALIDFIFGWQAPQQPPAQRGAESHAEPVINVDPAQVYRYPPASASAMDGTGAGPTMGT
jgi:hypothetical protein